MANNPYVNKVQYGNQTVMDISDSTAEESDVLTGKSFYKKNGQKSTGTLDPYVVGDAAETDIADEDYFPFYDTSASGKRKTLWSNIKAKLIAALISPTPNANLTESTVVQTVNAAQGTNANVPSLFGIQKWSNVAKITLYTIAAKDVDTIGIWVDGDAWKEAGASRVGWLWHECLYDILNDDDVEITPVFDAGNSEVVSLYGYRIDDDIPRTINGQTVNGGAIAFKLNNKIKNASGIKVGITIKRQRTQVIQVTPLS